MYDFSAETNELSGAILGAAMKTHTLLGPGLLERVYKEAMCHFLAQNRISFVKEKDIPIRLDEISLDVGFRIDLLVEDKIIVEFKAVERILPIHEAQLHTYLKLTGLELGLILNFNVISMKDGIKRIVMKKTPRNSVNSALENIS
jgi:GxxExxY protein